MNEPQRSLHAAVLRPETPLRFSPSGVLPAAQPSQNAALQAGTEARRVRRVWARCGASIQEACGRSSVPAEFLGALTANESGGDAAAVRFEPSVYGHLKALAGGERPHYAGIGPEALGKELEALLHPKTGEYHARFLNSAFMKGQRQGLAAQADEALRGGGRKVRVVTKFFQQLFSESGEASFARLGAFVALVFACGWVSYLVLHTHVLPSLEGLTLFVGALYGLGKANETLQRFIGGK